MGSRGETDKTMRGEGVRTFRLLILEQTAKSNQAKTDQMS